MSKDNSTHPSPTLTNFKSKGTHELLGAFALISIWALLLFQLSITWNTNEQYAHGYLVPFLCVFMLLKADSYDPSVNRPTEASVSRKWWLILGIPLLLALAPIWLIRGANSDWRLLNVVLFAVVFAITLLIAYKQGGLSE